MKTRINMKKEKGINFKLLAICFTLVFLTSFIGSMFSSTNTNSEWYNSIKPNITPPGFVFPIVWSILYLFIFISMYLSINQASKKEKIKLWTLFVINLILNTFWSYFFFYSKNPPLAFVDIILMLVSTLILLKETHKISKTSFYLLVPYFLWIGFASILNYLAALKFIN